MEGANMSRVVIRPVGQAGEGVPTGGTTGQVLAKASNTNFDTEWTDSEPAPVQSVNGETGVVVLDAGDVGAIPTTEKGVANGVATLGADSLVVQNLFFPKQVPVVRYSNQTVAGLSNVDAQTTRTRVFPVQIFRTGTLSTVGINVTTISGSGTIRIAYYSWDNTTGGISFVEELGSFSATTLGFQNITINKSVRAGVHFFAIMAFDITTNPTISGFASNTPFVFTNADLLGNRGAFNITVTGNWITGPIIAPSGTSEMIPFLLMRFA